MLRDHPHISRVTQEFRVEKDGTFTAYWILHTSLVLDALDPAYEVAKVSELVDAVSAHCAKQQELRGRILIREE